MGEERHEGTAAPGHEGTEARRHEGESTAPDERAIERAAGLIRAGRLVAFPTETVYGLGANALDAAAVAAIFHAKGRPARNPIIVHVATVDAARALVREWPGAADVLARKFWPGPLTLVLLKAACVPDIVTAGGDTVAIRCPAHPVALALLQVAGVPIAAPSANRSNHISPTRAKHVRRSLGDRVDMVLDGGPTTSGIESTVVDLVRSPRRVLRLGPITPSEIAAALGEPVLSGAMIGDSGVRRSPGQLPRHYSPRAGVVLLQRGDVAAIGDAGAARVGWLALADEHAVQPANLTRIDMPPSPTEYAARLYDALHVLDAMSLERIFVTMPPDEEAWHAVRDRLARAAGTEA
ncbi:MAG: L-threonylcarbamoyladenylate synthase [Phycisphaerae bacterium]